MGILRFVRTTPGTDFTLTIPLPYKHAHLGAQVVSGDGNVAPLSDVVPATFDRARTADAVGEEALEPVAVVALTSPADAGDYLVRWASSDGFEALDALFVTAPA